MDITKIGVIIRHEFLTRIRTKAFILATLLAPLGLLAIIAIPVIATLNSEDSAKTIAVVDYSGKIGKKLIEQDSALFVESTLPLDSLRRMVRHKQLNAYLVIPATIGLLDSIQLFSSGGGGLRFYGTVEDAVYKVIRRERMIEAGADSTILSLLKAPVNYSTKKISESGVEKDSGEILAVLGYVLGFFIYMMMLIYGGVVMRAVLEEKTNRIVEVIASSAKPFEIMFGKIVGVGAMGLVQISLWIAMSVMVTTFAAPAIQSMVTSSTPEAASAVLNSQVNAPAPAATQALFELPEVSPWIPIGFVFYFLCGYFIYSSLFAAIAAAADQEADIQSLQLPVMLPLIIPMLFIANIISAPDGTLATILSMIPLFTPVLMIVRVSATHVPMWQIVVSSLMLIATFVAAVWAAGRVYRVGILSYGKKASFNDMARWLLRS